MIGYINGIVRHSRPPVVLIDVGGIGYEINAGENAFADLPPEGERTVFFTHVVAQNDSNTIFGFGSYEEREAFRILLTVNGIGPRSALSILSQMSIADLAACVSLENAGEFKKVPGVGAKTAGRLILELRGRLDELADQVVDDDAGLRPGSHVREIIDALISLGYSSREASQTVMAIRDEIESAEQGLRLALARLGTAAR